jgi:hypothetical protein
MTLPEHLQQHARQQGQHSSRSPALASNPTLSYPRDSSGDLSINLDRVRRRGHGRRRGGGLGHGGLFGHGNSNKGDGGRGNHKGGGNNGGFGGKIPAPAHVPLAPAYTPHASNGGGQNQQPGNAGSGQNAPAQNDAAGGQSPTATGTTAGGSRETTTAGGGADNDGSTLLPTLGVSNQSNGLSLGPTGSSTFEGSFPTNSDMPLNPNEAISNSKLSSGALATIIILCILTAAVVAVIIVRRRVKSQRRNRAEHWWSTGAGRPPSAGLLRHSHESFTSDQQRERVLSGLRSSAGAMEQAGFSVGHLADASETSCMVERPGPFGLASTSVAAGAALRITVPPNAHLERETPRRDSASSIGSNDSFTLSYLAEVPRHARSSTPISTAETSVRLPFSSDTFVFPTPPGSAVPRDGSSRPSTSGSGSARNSMRTAPRQLSPQPPSSQPAPLPNPFADPDTVSVSDEPTPAFHPELSEAETVRRLFLPTVDDDFEVRPGDQVNVIRPFDDGWAFVERVSRDGDTSQGMIATSRLSDPEGDLPLTAAARLVGSTHSPSARGSTAP